MPGGRSRLNLPKVPDAGYLRALGEVIDELERERGMPVGHTRIIAMIETAEGLANMADDRPACEPGGGITIGAEDLALDSGIEPEADGLYVANMNLLAAARAARIVPIGYLGSVAQFSDRDAVSRGRRAGARARLRGRFLRAPEPGDDPQRGVQPGRAADARGGAGSGWAP